MNQYSNLVNIEEYKKYLDSFLDQEMNLDMYRLHYKLSIYYLSYYRYRRTEYEILSLFKDKVIKENKMMILDDIDKLVDNSKPKILRG